MNLLEKNESEECSQKNLSTVRVEDKTGKETKLRGAGTETTNTRKSSGTLQKKGSQRGQGQENMAPRMN